MSKAIFVTVILTLLLSACEKEPRIPVERKVPVKTAKKPTQSKEAKAPQKDQAFNYRIIETETPQEMMADSIAVIFVKLRNISNRTWPVDGSIQLGYFWTDAQGARIKGASGRARIRKEIEPSKLGRIRARVKAPADQGEYFLVWDMVDDKTWFRTKGASPLKISVTVK